MIKQLKGIRDRHNAVCNYPGLVTLEESQADIPRLLSALEAVLELHRPDADVDEGEWCNACLQLIEPDDGCETVKAIKRALEANP